jgi:hypothetical protein
MLRAIAAAKKKNDRIDASKICDCLRCDFLPDCYMAPTASLPLGAKRYHEILDAEGFDVVGERSDEGGNYYYLASKC